MTAPPRVAHFTVAPEFVDRIMLHDLRRLRGREDVTVIATEGTALATVRAEGFPVVTVRARRKMSPLADLVTLWDLWRAMRRGRFDLVHTYAPKAGLLGQVAAMLAGVPRRIHGCRGLLYREGMSRMQRLVFRTTDRVTSALAHATVYVSRADLEYAVREGLCPASKARHIGSGIDLAEFARTPATEAAGRKWRRELGIADDETLVLAVGRYVADKGYAEIARAAAMVRAAHPRVRHVWVAPVFAGEDGVLPDSLLREAGVEDVVVRTGYIADMAPVYAAADLLVHASHREGVPRALMEAAALGVPIVASDIPGCREVIRDGDTGLLFRVHDAGDLARALGSALADPSATQARARRAQHDITTRFDHRALADRVWAVHEQVLSRGPASPARASA